MSLGFVFPKWQRLRGVGRVTRKRDGENSGEKGDRARACLELGRDPTHRLALGEGTAPQLWTHAESVLLSGPVG